jgi:triosephosphate isomerase (TIM)
MSDVKRRPIVAGNWKMNTTIDEGLALVDALKPLIPSAGSVDTVVCPPFVSLHAVSQRLSGSEIGVGAQNLHFEPKGAFTGEVSATMLAGLVQFVIVGHSERRQFFGDTDQSVAKKVRAALDAGLAPILCVGETLAERDAGETEMVLRRQTRWALEGLQSVGGLVIAYEPVWAIGTGKSATSAEANAGNAIIRDELAEVLGTDVAQATRIQYGGSVNPANAEELMGQPDIDGALVGGASLVAESFAAIVKAVAATA